MQLPEGAAAHFACPAHSSMANENLLLIIDLKLLFGVGEQIILKQNQPVSLFPGEFGFLPHPLSPTLTGTEVRHWEGVHTSWAHCVGGVGHRVCMLNDCACLTLNSL